MRQLDPVSKSGHRYQVNMCFCVQFQQQALVNVSRQSEHLSCIFLDQNLS